MLELGILGTLWNCGQIFLLYCSCPAVFYLMVSLVTSLLTLLNHERTLKMMTTMTMHHHVCLLASQLPAMAARFSDFLVEEMLAIIDK